MPSDKSELIVNKALELGATLAGLAPLIEMPNWPSYQAETWSAPEGDFQTVLVLALEHPIDQPLLDWWDGKGGTEGNRRMMEVSKVLIPWMADELGLKAKQIPYPMENGGLFLKDAAVLAGLGVIGRNNLLITPQYGPRVRFRTVGIDQAFPASGPIDFDPCQGCPAPCLTICPHDALKNAQYRRPACRVQMDLDIANQTVLPDAGPGEPKVQIKYCRECEVACLAANGGRMP